ncbi:hypothetical protein HDU99_004349 [Rhizoclosmatium hyalinum]|nr:hypothetical protein HDU99_004349 [Rhizoclosmatium hyalinum]
MSEAHFPIVGIFAIGLVAAVIGSFCVYRYRKAKANAREKREANVEFGLELNDSPSNVYAKEEPSSHSKDTTHQGTRKG